ncbi:MAG: hypothetical protein R3E82_02590 [Pseudomonadales bacterium]|nr:hypothetical protein [Pseudomonadales bacterium]
MKESEAQAVTIDSSINRLPQIWLLRLIPAMPYGRWWAAFTLFVGSLGIHFAAARLGGLDEWFGRQANFVLFFSTIIAYIIPVYHLIIERTRLALRQLTPLLNAEIEQVALWEDALATRPPRWTFIVLLISVTLGILHNWLLWDSGLGMTRALKQPDLLATIISSSFIWIVMTFVIASLISNALLFNRLSKRVHLDLLNTRALTPFASVAVSSTLAIIGAQAAFPILIFAGEMNPLAFVPGLFATGIPMLLLFFWPIWPVHRLLHHRKRRELERVDGEIARSPRPELNDQQGLSELNSKLNYRREIEAVSEWPFDSSAVSRLLLYLIIPPLTWVGAALIEILVDSAL